jgi:hypothetical protein
MLSRRGQALLWDAALVAVSVGVAVILVRTDVLISVLSRTHELALLGSFIAGMFFTSTFTVAPAAVTLGEIAQVSSLWEVALVGGLGAMVGDFVIFRFVRDRLSAHLMEYLEMVGGTEKLASVLTRKSTRWFSWILGGLLIASPLPDELAVTLLGASKMRTGWFAAVSFAFNALGILFISLAARAL